MPGLVFDTHKAVKALQAAGADEALAEAVVATVGEAIATKTDLKSSMAGLRSDVAEFKAEIKADIAALREDMAKGFQDLFKLSLILTLTLAGTIIRTAVALARYLAPQ